MKSLKLATTVAKHKQAITRTAHIVARKVAKRSPEILMAAGTVSIAAGFVLGCKATLRADEILAELDQSRENIEAVKEAAEKNESIDYPQSAYTRDKALMYLKAARGYAVLYAPSVALVGLGITCFFVAHNIMTKRNLALAAAYEAVSTAFTDYRNRVISDQGKEADERYMYGFEKLTGNEEKGHDPERPEALVRKIEDGQPIRASIYARFFDETCRDFVRDSEANLLTLHARQSMANFMLKDRGYLFLNDVYELLGLPKSTAGQSVGWIDRKDAYIDFGIYEVCRKGPGGADKAMNFVNGYEYAVLLDFNVDGPIDHLIDKM